VQIKALREFGIGGLDFVPPVYATDGYNARSSTSRNTPPSRFTMRPEIGGKVQFDERSRRLLERE